SASTPGSSASSRRSTAPTAVGASWCSASRRTTSRARSRGRTPRSPPSARRTSASRSPCSPRRRSPGTGRRTSSGGSPPPPSRRAGTSRSTCSTGAGGSCSASTPTCRRTRRRCGRRSTGCSPAAGP
ncbi:MAG: Glutathione peroxidase @ Thioredoxin peroxidase, partial [uncultured Solirubrobacteraceae bacterium]